MLDASCFAAWPPLQGADDQASHQEDEDLLRALAASVISRADEEELQALRQEEEDLLLKEEDLLQKEEDLLQKDEDLLQEKEEESLQQVLDR